jgi:hypothetical protein
MTTMTCEALAESLGLAKDHAYALVRMAVDLGWVTKAGVAPTNGKKGRGAAIYEVPDDFGARLAALWDNRKK